MDFSLNEEQRHWQSEARKFAEDEIRPISLQRDQIEGGFAPWNWDIIEKGSKLGFRTLAVPREWGGPGADFVSQALVMAELARTMIWKAAWVLDHPGAVADRSVSEMPLHVIARVYTAEAVNEVALLSAECFGAMGVMRDMPLQKYVHDSMVFLHSDQGDGAAKLEIAEALAGYQRPLAA